jgi:protein-S-isoprenylcysteine O-methyltransferase Ste14
VILLLKNLLFTLLMPGSVGVWIPWYLARPATDGGPISRFAAGILFALGGAIYAWCLWDFATFGRGTPAPIDAPKHLVVRGLYRYSRNPMYVGILAVICGWILLYGSVRLAFYGALVATTFHWCIRLYEEPHLARLFGQEYKIYRERETPVNPEIQSQGAQTEQRKSEKPDRQIAETVVLSATDNARLHLCPPCPRLLILTSSNAPMRMVIEWASG